MTEEKLNLAQEFEATYESLLDHIHPDDREMRIIEMKEEVNKLSEELGKKPPYSTPWET